MKQLSLRQARAAKGWTQEQLEAASGIPQQTISKIENGATDDPQNSTVVALEQALGIRRGTLVFGDQERVAS